MQFLCVCSAFRLVTDRLGLSDNPKLVEILKLMQFLEHVPKPQPVDYLVEDFADELRHALFEMEPEAIHRVWARLRVKNTGYNVQTPEERDFATVEEFDTELSDNGFEEIYWRSYGNKLPEVLEVLERVGASDTKALLDEAMEMLGTPYPVDQKDRQRAWKAKASKRVKKNKWELKLDELRVDYLNLEESCVDVAAQRVTEGYRKRGMPVPPEFPQPE